MAVLSNTGIRAGASAAGGSGYQVEKSLRFDPGDQAHLTKTPSSEGNRKTWTWSGWVKRSGFASYQNIFAAGTNIFDGGSGGQHSTLCFDSTHHIQHYNYEGGYGYYQQSEAEYRDPSAWMHIVAILDTTNSTAADRAIVYVNGERMIIKSGDVQPTQNTAYSINKDHAHYLGLNNGDTLNGYMADVHFIDGQALDASSFGETDGTTGKWIAKKYAGDYNYAEKLNLKGTTNNEALDVVVNRVVDKCWIKSDGNWVGGGNPSDTGSAPTFHILNGEAAANLYWATTAYDEAHTVTIGTSSETGTQPQWADSSGSWSTTTTVASGTFSSSYGHARTGAMTDGNVYAFTYTIDAPTGGSSGANHSGWFITDSVISSYASTAPDEQTSINSVGSRWYAALNDGGYSMDHIAVYGDFVALNKTGSDSSYTFLGGLGLNSFYLKFTGSDLGEDSSGINNDWTATNLTAASTNLDVPCVKFDGTDDYLEIADSTDFDFGTSDFTLECFVNPDPPASDAYRSLVMKADAGTTYAGSSWWWALYSYAAGTSISYCYIYDGSTYKILQGSSLTNGKWHHIAVVRDGDTARLYHNGVQVDSISVSGWTQNSCSNTVRIGSDGGANYDMDGAISNVRIVNGTCLYPSGTTFTVPSRPLANVTNTKLLCCQSSSTTADDNSDNDHTITASGNAAAGTASDDTSDDDAVIDSPTDFDDGGSGTGNYCTLNPLAVVVGSPTFRQGNLQIVGTSWTSALATMPLPATGKWYFETVIDSDYSPRRVNNYASAGFGESDAQWIQSSVQIIDFGGVVEAYPSTTNTYLHANGTFALDDVAGWAIDMDNWKFSIYKNGTVLVDSRDIPQDKGTQLWPFCANYNLDYGYLKMNFGQLGFQQTPPTDYKALNTYNLPDPTIKDPSKYFDASIYTGAGSSVDVSTNFSPDLVWVKSRLSSASHNIIDAVRGDDNYLMTNSTAGEDDSYADVLELKSDGYTVGSNNSAFSGTNGNIGWAWDAGEANTVDSSVNADQTWSSSLTSSHDGVTAATNAFNNDVSTYAKTGSYGSDRTLTFGPSTAVNFSSKLEVYCDQGSATPTATWNSNTVNPGSGAWVTVYNGSGSISSSTPLVIDSESTSEFATLGGVRLDGKVLTDPSVAPSVIAGGLNSTVYDQSDTWSDDGANAVSGNPWTNGFDGDDQNTVYADHNQTATWTPDGTITGITSLEVKGYATNAGGTYSKFKINGTDYTSTFGSDYDTWKTITGITTLTSISVGQESGTAATGFVAVRINGKELIDTGVSVTTVPTLASTYRANPSAGFSIVSYEATGTVNKSIAHGLNAKPDFMILKSRDSTANWNVWHKDYTTDQQKVIYLNLDSSGASYSGGSSTWWYASPDSNVFWYGEYGSSINMSDGDKMIAYCWSEVAGYSKFGSFTGNGSTDGSFIWCGFRPAWVMFKRTNMGYGWVIFDSKRDPYNEANVSHLHAEATNAEADGDEGAFDMVSNGFKMRGDWNINNASGGEYIFAAFAETPFKYANAR